MKPISSPARTLRPSPIGALAAALVAFAVFAAPVHAQGAKVTAKDAWVREATGARKVTGAFLVLENPGTVARSVVSGTADVAEKLELHEMVRDGTMMKMSPVKSIEIPAGGKTELKPGGLHLMLFGLKRPLAAGDSIHVTLTLDDGSTVMLMAGVRKPGAMP
ncbi:MAG: copper chaperone PCu(A)C [Gemmatimonadetes bacterium]|nr:copper chaperone PCu(A)C [Gemmatimonadota bacterium]MBK6845408.1 copper chaperone PCu(A)C [Gemmatimonadota bacterium]HPV76696.1 copper chaperone PCu(A)C [Gemmatimonadaceae bacterium]